MRPQLANFETADRIADMGFNAIRMWGPCAPADQPNGPSTLVDDKTGEFLPFTKGDGSPLDEYDHFFAEAKSKGLFTMATGLTDIAHVSAKSEWLKGDGQNWDECDVPDKSDCSDSLPSHSGRMSETGDIIPFKVQKGEALHRQITNHFRAMISSGKLPPGSKLSRMHDLAEQWNTNYFTVHTALTRLVREGLLERKPRLGTFVRKQIKQLSSVGIYYGEEILIKHERAFYRALHGQLLDLLQKEHISAKVFIDSRPRALQEEPLAELLESVNSNSIHGLIVPLIGYPKVDWISKMPLPTSLFSSERNDYSRICIDFNQIMTMACQTLSDQGCRSVGLIFPNPLTEQDWGKNEADTIPNAFETQAKAFNLKTHKSWFRTPKVHQESQEKYGYHEFHKLWSLKEKPDGLIVYPENVSHGVVLAALEMGVKVPSELKLVLHKNQNVQFLCPLPVDWIITRERDVADALIQQIKDRFAGLEPHYYEIHHEFVKGSNRDLISKFALANNVEA